MLNVSATMNPFISLVMGSSSDWETLRHAADILDQLPGRLREARDVTRIECQTTCSPSPIRRRRGGFRAIIAGAGGAAHLPGMLAAKTVVPVLGVPVASKHLNGVDSLYLIVQMPKGIPVATFAIGPAGAANAALFCRGDAGRHDDALRQRLQATRERQTEAARAMTQDLRRAPAHQVVGRRWRRLAAAAHAPLPGRDARRAGRRAARAHVRARSTGAWVPRRGARSRADGPAGGRRICICSALHRQRGAGAWPACAAVTTEFENVPAGTMASWRGHAGGAVSRCRGDLPAPCPRESALRGSPACPVRPHAALIGGDAGWPRAALLPGILKTATLGYDGKGQAVVADYADLTAAWSALGAFPACWSSVCHWPRVQRYCRAGCATAQMVRLPVQQNLHRDGILAVTLVPAPDIVDPRRRRPCACRGARGSAGLCRRAVRGVLCARRRPFDGQRNGAPAAQLRPLQHRRLRYRSSTFRCGRWPVCLWWHRASIRAVMLNLLGDLWFAAGTRAGRPPWAELAGPAGCAPAPVRQGGARAAGARWAT